MGEDARLRAVVALARSMAAAHTPRDVAHAAADSARAALDGSFAAVSVWERARARLRVLANVGRLAEGEETFPEDESYPVHDFPEITGFLHARWAGDPAGDGTPPAWVETRDGPGGSGPPAPYCHQRVAALRRRGRGCCVVAPIVLHGRAWGELYIAREPGEPVFTADDAGFATALAALVAAGVAQSERLEEVRRLAFTDPLTGLANRRAVDARLEEALERHRADGTVVTLAVCDVNGLKRVNDAYGHEEGDRLLARFAALLSGAAAQVPGALAARLGGDEFCLLAAGPPAEEVLRAADGLCERAAGLALGEGVACGLASTGDPVGPVRSARRLFRLADAAQYRAKSRRAERPVVAGRDGETPAGDPVVRLADAPPGQPERPEGDGRRRRGDRRRFRGG